MGSTIQFPFKSKIEKESILVFQSFVLGYNAFMYFIFTIVQIITFGFQGLGKYG